MTCLTALSARWSREPPVVDMHDRSDVVHMVSFHREIKTRWVPPFSMSGLFRRRELRNEVQLSQSVPLSWRRATRQGWPQNGLIGREFRCARRDGYGFVADVEMDRLFLVPRDYDEPEWGLAVYHTQQLRWRDLADLEPSPEHWVFPPVEERTSQSNA